MNIIITGAGKGIGHALTEKFLEKKQHAVYALTRIPEQLKLLQKKYGSNASSNLHIIKCEITDESSALEAIREIVKAAGNIDVLINNAGMLINKPFEQLDESDFLQSYSVNVFAAARMIRLCLSYFNQNERGHVVNIGSMGGFQGAAKFEGLSAYSSAKAALAGLTECLAEEFRDRNISFNCLALGAAQTEMLAAAFPGYKAPVTADEMAAFIADFSINASKYFNGKIIPVSVSTP